ncbi:MAG: trypsin-like peptidase domain-containing protein [Oscillospiraceae bacterium]|nr:trypsin-like peptidase domain-containing protein [Oscillospiraceae bacterium]
MTENLDNNQRTGEEAAPDIVREVVLRYEAPRPKPVVERYVQPQPLPGRRAAQEAGASETEPVPGSALVPGTAPVPEAAPAAAGKKKKNHAALWILLLCAALWILPRAGNRLLSRAVERVLERGGEASERYGYYAELPKRSGKETTIARAENTMEVRLRYSETQGEPLSIQQVYERVNPCTVTVATTLDETSASVGTGVIFTEDGYILTNAHVIEGGSEAFVVLNDGRLFRDVRLVGYDTVNDLAVLKIEATGLSVAEFGDSDALSVGDTVYAIGNPLGIELRGTLTDGIVSAINRDVEVDGVTMTLIQTNAALNNGNSGGPLINVSGQVVGINTMKMGSQSSVSVEGLGFAIPISSAAWMVDDLLAYGEVRGEPSLGILVEAGTLATGENAVLVRSVTPGGACSEAGILAGDAIVGAEGEKVETIADLLRIRRRFRAGETMTLEIARDGVRSSVSVTLRASEE